MEALRMKTEFIPHKLPEKLQNKRLEIEFITEELSSLQIFAKMIVYIAESESQMQMRHAIGLQKMKSY